MFLSILARRLNQQLLCGGVGRSQGRREERRAGEGERHTSQTPSMIRFSHGCDISGVGTEAIAAFTAWSMVSGSSSLCWNRSQYNYH